MWKRLFHRRGAFGLVVVVAVAGMCVAAAQIAFAPKVPGDSGLPGDEFELVTQVTVPYEREYTIVGPNKSVRIPIPHDVPFHIAIGVSYDKVYSDATVTRSEPALAVGEVTAYEKDGLVAWTGQNSSLWFTDHPVGAPANKSYEFYNECSMEQPGGIIYVGDRPGGGSVCVMWLPAQSYQEPVGRLGHTPPEMGREGHYFLVTTEDEVKWVRITVTR